MFSKRNIYICITFFISMLLLTRSFPMTFGKKALTASMLSMSSAKDSAEKYIKDNKVMVFSKTYCPYCKKAKEELSKLTTIKTLELDNIPDGDDIQKALLDMTGQKTVPNIFIGGKHIGGCDKTVAMIASGELQKLL